MEQHIIPNNKFRLKLTDRCSLSCPFCHAEGGKNAADVVLGHDLLTALELLRPMFSRVHLTGGEPMLYPNLDKLMGLLQQLGFRVAMTTNGLFSFKNRIQVIQRLEHINFSVHSLRESYVKDFLKKGQEAAGVIHTIVRNIEQTRRIIPVGINAVVSGKGPAQGLEELLEFAGKRQMEVKLVPEWRVRAIAEGEIHRLLEGNGFQLFEKICLRPGSNVRERYRNPAGQIVEVKRIEFSFPDFLCRDCENKDICQEGFSFLRLGGDPLYVQLCIFKEKMTLREFESAILPHIREMFKEETEHAVDVREDRG